MLNKFLIRSFEQNTDNHLPFTVQRTVRSVAASVRFNSSDSFAVQQREIEFAHVTLHMRLYQRLGNRSNQIIDLAHAYLDELLAPAATPSTSTLAGEQLHPVAESPSL